MTTYKPSEDELKERDVKKRASRNRTSRQPAKKRDTAGEDIPGEAGNGGDLGRSGGNRALNTHSTELPFSLSGFDC